MRRASAAGVLALALAVIGVGAPSGFAAVVQFKADLRGRAEVPAVATPGKGDLTAQLDTDTHVLTYKVTYTGLSGPAMTAHLHGPAKAGQTAPPLVTVTDASSPISGHATLTPAQEADLQRGLWYFDVQTAVHPDGEIRGQIKRVVDWGEADSPAGPPSGWQYMPRGNAQIGNR
jgi:hypothetical protein